MVKRASFKRWNPLLGEWVIIAPTTDARPWSGTLVTATKQNLPEYDPGCYLCSGVRRASGQVNPKYKSVYVFENDFPTLSMNYMIENGNKPHPLDGPARGVCRVVCFDPKHNTTLAEMEREGIANVISIFQKEFRELSSVPGIENVMIFENKGEVIGVSNPHPHGQIYATDFVPRNILTEYYNARQHMDKEGTCLFCSIMEEELSDGRRIVCQNGHFVSYVPYFARHAYEVHIVSRRHVPSIAALNENETYSLVDIYREILIRYDNIFEMPFPNITIFHSAPCAEKLEPEPYHFHIEFCPPLRSSDKLKHMAGFEVGGGNIINPAVPCESAEMLRSVSTVHYATRSL